MSDELNATRPMAVTEMTIPLEKLFFIIEKAREFDEEVPADAGDTDSNPTDDGESAILLDTPDNGTPGELRDALMGLNVDEQEDLLALLWIGRGDFTPAEWKAARQLAGETHDRRAAEYLIGTPLLSDYLEEAATGLGLSFETLELGRL